MNVPTTAHLLRCVAFTMDNLVRPDPAGKGAMSALATATHLLRYAGLRIEQDGALLAADIRALRTLLGELQAYLAGLGTGEPGADTLARELAAAVAPGASTAPEGRDVPSLAAEAGKLRECLYRTQKLLQGDMRGRRGNESDYQRVRASVRTYVAAELEREAGLVEPAFRGRGPRR